MSTSFATALQRVDADRHLRANLLIVPQPETGTDQDEHWRTWFERWSLPVGEVNDGHLHDLLETVPTTTLGGQERLLGPASLKRIRAVIRPAFKSAYRPRLITWDPWDAVEWKLPAEEDPIDADLVMDPAQVFELADACGAIDRRYECFVLIQEICGLRPAEARDL